MFADQDSSYTKSNFVLKHRVILPVSMLFDSRRIFLLDTEGTVRSCGLQAELRQVWHCEVDWTIVSDKRGDAVYLLPLFKRVNVYYTPFLPAQIFNLNKRFGDPACCKLHHNS